MSTGPHHDEVDLVAVVEASVVVHGAGVRVVHGHHAGASCTVARQHAWGGATEAARYGDRQSKTALIRTATQAGRYAGPLGWPRPPSSAASSSSSCRVSLDQLAPLELPIAYGL